MRNSRGVMDVCRALFNAGIEAVQPAKLVREALTLPTPTTLTITTPPVCTHPPDSTPRSQNPYTLQQNVYIAAFGKASLGMTQAAVDILKDHVVRGIVSTPMGTEHSHTLPPRILVREGAQGNLPDEGSLQTAQAIAEMAKSLGQDDLLLVLVSGGGSALLPLPLAGVSLTQKQHVIRQLANRGADIQQLNTVRQQLSQIKAGGLARMAAPARVLSLIFSDIIRNPPELIASGPTVEPLSTRAEARSILEKYGIDAGVFDALPPPPHDPSYSHVSNHIIGSNITCLEAINNSSVSIGYRSIVVTDSMECSAEEAGLRIGKLVHEILEWKLGGRNLEQGDKFPKDPWFEKVLDLIGNKGLVGSKMRKSLNEAKICLIFGGETTVKVKSGKGGRNQHLALVLLRTLCEHREFSDWDSKILAPEHSKLMDGGHSKIIVDRPGLKIDILAAGTDGQDGPTDAAGAIFDLEAVRKIVEKSNLEQVDDFAERTDAYNFWDTFAQGKYHLKIGPTGTNVMDLVIVLINFS